jgi:hypothetical protein
MGLPLRRFWRADLPQRPGCPHDVSISGAWIATGLPANCCRMQVGFTAIRIGRKTMARVEGLIVRLADHGFGVEWCELAHPVVLAILMVHPRKSQMSAAKQGSPS